jgi:hypothetical protein
MRVSESTIVKSPGHVLIAVRKYREDHLEKENARCLAYYHKNKQKMNQQRKLNYHKKRALVRNEEFASNLHAFIHS